MIQCSYCTLKHPTATICLINLFISADLYYYNNLNNANNLQVQEEMIEDDLPIVLENDDSARLGGSTYLLDYGQDVSLSDNESDREISKVKY